MEKGNTDSAAAAADAAAVADNVGFIGLMLIFKKIEKKNLQPLLYMIQNYQKSRYLPPGEQTKSVIF